MTIELELRYLAPIPVGHRVQIIYAHQWKSPLFGGQPRWEPNSTPILVDLETSIVYVGWGMRDVIVTAWP